MNVSVIIPTYNRATLVERALCSVYGQTLSAAEVILIDDGSTDGTLACVRRRFPLVRCIQQPNRGVSSARNRGIREAAGEWLAFLDSDDEWLPRKLELQQRALAANPQYRICHSGEIWIKNGRRVSPKKKHAKHGGRIFQRCLPLCLISPSAVVLHRSVVDSVGLFNERLPACEDYDLWLRICAVYPVLYVAQPLLRKHAGHADQLSRRYPAMDRFRIEALEDILRSGRLAVGDRRAALRVLFEKIEVYAGGAAKRGHWDEVARYRHKQAAYEALVSAPLL